MGFGPLQTRVPLPYSFGVLGWGGLIALGFP